MQPVSISINFMYTFDKRTFKSYNSPFYSRKNVGKVSRTIYFVMLSFQNDDMVAFPIELAMQSNLGR